MNNRRTHRQHGFTLIELIMVIVVGAILAIIGIPALQSTLMSGKAPEIAKVVQQAVVKLEANRQGGGTWTTANTQELASLLQSDSRVTVSGTAPNQTIAHNIGENGVLTFGPGQVVNPNDGGKIVATNVNGDACTDYTNALQKVAGRMLVNGTVVKAAGGTYNGSATQTACQPGDVNNVEIDFN